MKNRNFLRTVIYTLIALVLAAVAYAIAQGYIIVGVICLILPFMLFYVIRSFECPILSLYSLLIYSFLAIAVGIYLRVEGGLLVDFLLVFCYIALFIRGFRGDIPWHRALTSLYLVVSLWMLYTFLEFFNPEAPSRLAWFYGMRSAALYIWLFVPLGLILLDKVQHLKWFLYIWCGFSILATLYGCVQLYGGLNSFEQALMDAGKAQTHLLFGKLRVFSFYSDAGQFGAAQAQIGITALFLFLGEKNKHVKLLYFVTCLSGFYGLLISGTRGAIFVPIAAALMYLLIKRNIKVLILGTIVIGIAFFLLKYTYIGQDVYSIRRMRTAFDIEDASFQVRIENQRLFREYLKTRPFGGGIGVTGDFGARFSPDAYLSNIPTDSGYVKIWAEYGIVGLICYLFMWGFIVIYGIRVIWYRLKDKWLKNVMIALLCGMVGMLVANYGNAIIVQLPSSIILCFSVVFIFVATRLDSSLSNTQI